MVTIPGTRLKIEVTKMLRGLGMGKTARNDTDSGDGLAYYKGILYDDTK